MDQAYQLRMTSIAFPSVIKFYELFLCKIFLIFKIGTGQIGLDPNKVCESMINAASERLHKYKMDVLFVIYASGGSGKTSHEVIFSFIDLVF